MTGRIWKDGGIQEGHEHERESEATVNGNVNQNAVVGKNVQELFCAAFVVWTSIDLKSTPAHILSHALTS